MLFIQKFVDLALALPEVPAIVDVSSKLSYGELYDQAQRLAEVIALTSSGPLIGVLMEKSIDYIVSILAIHLLGRTVVPLDRSYPVERLQQMITSIDLSLCLLNKQENVELTVTRIDHDIGYADYARRQQQYLDQQWAIDAGFFKGLYNAFEGPTVLSAHPGFTSIAACSSSRYSVEVAGANRTLSDMAERHGFSVFNAILYVYAKTMADVIGCDQLIISAINSGRGLSEFNNVIGPFTSPLPVPITVHHDWLSGISMVARTLEAIQGYPLMHPSMLIGEVSAFSGMAHDTYFSDVGINFLNYRHTAEAPGKVRIEGVEILGPVSEGLLSGVNVEDMRRVPGLHLVVEINGGDLRFNFWFHTQRFSTAEVEDWGHRMVQHLKQLLSLARTTDEH